MELVFQQNALVLGETNEFQIVLYENCKKQK